MNFLLEKKGQNDKLLERIQIDMELFKKPESPIIDNNMCDMCAENNLADFGPIQYEGYFESLT